MHPRFVEGRIREALKDTPVVALNGPRQSGKTTLARLVAEQDRTYLTLDDATTLEAARSDPAGFVRGLDTAIIDEVQRAPDLMLALKRSVDEDRRPGRFLITGSANLLTIKAARESLAGRMEVITLLPLAQAEVLEAAEPLFLTQAFTGKLPKAARPPLGADLVNIVLTGGYPDVLARESARRRRDWCRAYIDAIAERDVRDISTIEKPSEIPNLIRVAAHHSGQLLNFTTISTDLRLARKTVESYLDVLEQLFLVRRLEPWHRNDLSRLIKTPKLHFMDSALLAAARGVTAERITAERALFGPILETFVFAELQRLASWSESRMRFSHYRDKDQLEVDIVLENEEGGMVGIEVKAAATVTAADFKGLKRLADIAGETFRLGVVLYDGDQTVSFGDNLLAAPIASLWAH
ncbi:ATP-binding protein [Phenylobacterium sp.]|uniref:ATP-binding protein n=1 Tax=Phenylobacterium sp. TaxID=1871053 RepID=UPI002731B922|nr:ATP-binding protein [Phenylobacterium sp.]MDP1598537.1 ATP-binding protein [Phenylobacterium sp.]MDP3592572.1 ATP-binding protein [Phenylobacterium sp.]